MFAASPTKVCSAHQPAHFRHVRRSGDLVCFGMSCADLWRRAVLAGAVLCSGLMLLTLPAQGAFDATGYSSSASFVAGGYVARGRVCRIFCQFVAKTLKGGGEPALNQVGQPT